jgi:hypothetical protein
VNIHIARALAALLAWHEIDFPDIGDEVGMKNAAVIFREILPFFGEKLGVAGIETVFKHIIRVEDKLGVAEKLERHRLAGERKIAAGLGAAGIMMLVPCVKWNREGAASFPFEDSLRRAFVPHAGRAPASSDGDDFFIELTLRFGALSRIDLGDVGIGNHLIGKRANSPLALLTVPISKFLGAHVLDECPADDRHAFGFDPFFIRTIPVHHELDIRMDLKFLHRPCHINHLVDSMADVTAGK